jgi:hypothetical protein
LVGKAKKHKKTHNTRRQKGKKMVSKCELGPLYRKAGQSIRFEVVAFGATTTSKQTFKLDFFFKPNF